MLHQYRPPRGAWRSLEPGSVPDMFRDLDDENEYYDSIALAEYTTSTRRQFVLNLSRREPKEVRAVSLEKLLWELPGLGGATTMSAKGKKELDESLGAVARTILVQCSGYRALERNHTKIQRLLQARNKDPLCLFLARLLDIPNESLSEAACSVLLSITRAPGRSALRDMTSMDMGDMTRLVLVRIYHLFQRKKKPNQDHRSSLSFNSNHMEFKSSDTATGNNADEDNGNENYDPTSGLLKLAHTQGFHLLLLLFELTHVSKALPWLRHGIVQLFPALLEALVPEGARGTLSNMLDPHTGLLQTTVSFIYSSSCRDLDAFETLCRVITSLSKDAAAAQLMVESDFVTTWFWMLREQRTLGDGKENGCNRGGHAEDDEHQRRVVRSFFDVLWEWTYSSNALMPDIQQVLIKAMESNSGEGGDVVGGVDGGGGGGGGKDNGEGSGKSSGKGSGTWVEDECDVVVRCLHPSSDLVMQACGIVWNCFGDKQLVQDLEPYFLERGLVEKISLIMLESQDCGVLTCCAGALYNLVQTDSLTFHVSSQEGLIDHLKWLKVIENATELVHDQKDRLLGDPALRYRGAAVERPSAGLAASALSANSKVKDIIDRLSKACDKVLRRVMGDEDEELHHRR